MHVGNFSNVKGDKLQKAVEAIESLIISTNSSLSKAKIDFEPKKITFDESNVRHEIDIYVKADLADGYESIFIFECKNTEKNVGSREIILFSEKIKVTNAQKGFFIAKGFGKFAKRQALKNKKIELVIADDKKVDLSFLSDLEFSYHTREPKEIVSEIGFFDGKEFVKNEGKQEELTLNGEKIEFKNFVKSLVKKTIESRIKEKEIMSLTEGHHKDQIKKEYVYNDRTLTLNNKRIYRIFLLINLTIAVTIIKPQIVSYFDVKKRGRFYKFESYKARNGFEYNISIASKDNFFSLTFQKKKDKNAL